MDDPLLVRRLQRLGDLLRDRQRLVERNRAARDPLGKVFALDELHHERADAARFFKAVDVRDVRMVQRREDLRFAAETRQAIGIAGEASRAEP